MAILVAGGWLASSLPSHAQIASYVDERGKLVYTNGDSPAPPRRGSIRPHGTGSDSSPAVPLTSASPPDRLDRIVREASNRHQLDPALIKAVITTESGWNAQAVSRKGAVGLMQLAPGTAERYGVGNAFDPAQNVEAGATYLRSLLDRYRGDLTKSLAAYNAGERNVDRWHGVPGIPETQAYVQKVTDRYFRPGSGRDPKLWDPPKVPMRKEVEPNGRVVFTNE